MSIISLFTQKVKLLARREDDSVIQWTTLVVSTKYGN